MSGIKDIIIDDSCICAVHQEDGKKMFNSVLLYDLIETGCVDMIEDLLKHGTDVNLKFENGNMPLHFATIKGREEVAKLFISCGADINAQDGNGDTPIFHATKNGDLKMMELLLSNGADIRYDPELLNTAVENKDIEIVEILLRYGVDVDSRDIYGRTALLIITLDENLVEDSVYEDLDHSNVRGEIAKLLLNWGANVNAQTLSGCTALQNAVESGYVKVVEALLKYKADVNPASLYESARKGFAEITEMLLNKGADVNATLEDGMTALHIATLEGHKEVVEVLLKAGAKINSKNDIHMTPLHLAAMYSTHSHIVNILLKFGADIDCRDEFGSTALHIASENGHAENVTVLLNHGSDINIKNENWQTPFDCAAIQFIVSNGQLLCCCCHNHNHEDYFVDTKTLYAGEITTGILKRHIIKLKTAKLYVNVENLELLDSCDELLDIFHVECEKELAYMKSQKIYNTNVTYYDILRKNINQLALIVRNENILQVLRSEDLKIKFPNYGSMIESNIRKGKIRNNLMEQNNMFFDILVNSIPGLPYTCVEHIFCYLNDEDLRILIEACKPTNMNSSNNI